MSSTAGHVAVAKVWLPLTSHRVQRLDRGGLNGNALLQVLPHLPRFFCFFHRTQTRFPAMNVKRDADADPESPPVEVSLKDPHAFEIKTDRVSNHLG